MYLGVRCVGLGTSRTSQHRLASLCVAFSIVALSIQWSTQAVQSVALANIPPAPTSNVLLAPSLSAHHITPAVAAARVATLLKDPRLGKSVSVVFIDASTNRAITSYHPSVALMPASSMKTLTATAALSLMAPTKTFDTKVTRKGRTLTIVGGGDPTLQAKASHWSPIPSGSSRPATIDALADQVAKSIGSTNTQFIVQADTRLFDRVAINPHWKANYVADGEVGRISALTVNEGMTPSGHGSTNPTLMAEQAFASALAARGVKTQIAKKFVAQVGASQIGVVHSQTLIDLVEIMLTVSDNTIAEFLAHHIGGTHGARSFINGAAVTKSALMSLGIPTSGLVIFDGSGLSRDDRVSAKTFASSIRFATRGKANTWPLLTGLPIGGVMGTLGSRYISPPIGRGIVRAKTGSLDGTASLTGMFTTVSHDVVVFSIVANNIPAKTGLVGARKAMDAVVVSLVQCGCH